MKVNESTTNTGTPVTTYIEDARDCRPWRSLGRVEVWQSLIDDVGPAGSVVYDTRYARKCHKSSWHAITDVAFAVVRNIDGHIHYFAWYGQRKANYVTESVIIRDAIGCSAHAQKNIWPHIVAVTDDVLAGGPGICPLCAPKTKEVA